MSKIAESKLVKFKDLVIETSGDYLPAQLAALKIQPHEVDDYQKALVERWPEIFATDSAASASSSTDASGSEPEAKKPVPAQKDAKPFRFIDEHNHVHDLEVVKETGSAIFLRKPVKRELVTVLVKGKPVEVDLLELRKAPANAVHPKHGVANSALLALGEIAKA